MDGFSYSLHSNIGWVVAPRYEDARPEMDYLHQALSQIGAVKGASFPNTPGPFRIELHTGGFIRSISAQDTARISSESPDWILMVEAAQMPYEAYLRCDGRMGPNRGRLMINGTLEGSTGWFAELVRSWSAQNADDGVAFKIPAWSNLHKYPGGFEDEEIQRLLNSQGYERFMERFGGEPQPPKGLVHPELTYKTHVRPIYWDSPRGLRDPWAFYLPDDLPLQLWIDPGWAHGYSVLLVGIHEERVFIIDEVYTDHRTTDEVIDECTTKPWWGRVELIVGDVAGEQHQAMKSPAEIWRKRTKLPWLSRKVGILDGITRTADFLRVHPQTGQPQLYISPSCPKTLWEYTEGYKWKLDTDSKVAKKVPEDQNNHSAKAIVYGLVHNFGLSPKSQYKYERQLTPWEKRRQSSRQKAHINGWIR